MKKKGFSDVRGSLGNHLDKKASSLKHLYFYFSEVSHLTFLAQPQVKRKKIVEYA